VIAESAPPGGGKDVVKALDLVLGRAMRDTNAQAIVAARLDGLSIAARFASRMDPKVAAAVAASIYGAAEVVSRELAQGPIEQITLTCANGRVVAVGAGPEAVLFAVYPREGALGLALLSLTRAGSQIATLLEGL